jgi:hypothetical protein
VSDDEIPEAYDGVDELDEVREPGSPEDAFGLVSAAEIAKRGIVEPEWDIESIIEARNGPTLLTAAPDRYKTWFAMLVCLAIATGGKLFGEFAARRRPHVIYLNLDAGKVATENRVARLGREIPDNFYVATWYTWDAQRFRRLLAAFPEAFVVIDCFANVFVQGEKRVDQGEAMRLFLQDLRIVYEEYGCSGIVVDHAARTERDDGDNFSGSQQKKATTRQGITLKRPPKEEDTAEPGRHVIHIGCLKMSEAEPFPAFAVEFSWVDGYLATKFLGFDGATDRRRQQMDRDAEAIKGILLVSEGHLLSAPVIIEAAQRLKPTIPRDRVYATLRGHQYFTAIGETKSRRYRLSE